MFIYSRIDSRIDLMKEISKSFDFDLATKRNNSFKYFIEKLEKNTQLIKSGILTDFSQLPGFLIKKIVSFRLAGKTINIQFMIKRIFSLSLEKKYYLENKTIL